MKKSSALKAFSKGDAVSFDCAGGSRGYGVVVNIASVNVWIKCSGIHGNVARVKPQYVRLEPL